MQDGARLRTRAVYNIDQRYLNFERGLPGSLVDPSPILRRLLMLQ